MANGADERLAARAREAEAKAKGFQPFACPECGNWTVVIHSPHFKCDTCGEDLRMGSGGELEKIPATALTSEDPDGIPLHNEDGC